MAHRYLVNILRDNIEARLKVAYIELASVWLNNRVPLSHLPASDWQAMAGVLRNVEAPIHLQPACEDIASGYWAPIEIYNALGHMEVLLAAIQNLRILGLTPNVCMPTQQYTDSDSSEIQTASTAPSRLADLESDDFVLEAYGGVNYRNNSKAALDFEAVRLAQKKKPGRRCFIALRRNAILSRETGKELPNWKEGMKRKVSCGKRHAGAAFTISANILKRIDTIEGYSLIELGDIIRKESAGST